MNIFQFPDTKSAQQFLDSFCEHPPIITAAQLTKIKIPIDAEKIGSVRLIDANIFTDYQTLNRILYGSRRIKESNETPTMATRTAWSFAGATAENFSEHVRRSIPFYEVGHDLVCRLSDFFVKPDTVVYEIGVSVGDLLIKLVQHHQDKSQCQWVGLDLEKNMIIKAQEKFERGKNVSLKVADIVLYDLEPTDLVVSYYCIQFISPKWRQHVIDKIYNALNWGGAFIWFEKVRACDARFQDIMTTLYTDYKLEQRYSADEIIAKTQSLKGVMEPFSTQGNLDLLKRAGFVDTITVFKYLCFEGLLAIK